MTNRLDQLRAYGLFRLVKIALSFIRTQVFYRPAMFVFFPIDIRGKRHIQLGKGMTCGTGCRFEAYPLEQTGKVLVIGQNVQINDYVHITAVHRVEIGNNVLMASRIYISDVSHGNYSDPDQAIQSDPESIVKDRPLFHRDVIIEDNVWIGEGASILPGVRIGRCSIIGANSVITKNIPANCIVAGNPGRIIRQYNVSSHRWERIIETDQA